MIFSWFSPPCTDAAQFPALKPSVFIGRSQVRGDDLALDRICFQVFIASGAKVSRERLGSFVLLMAETISSVSGQRGEGGTLSALEPGNCVANSWALMLLSSEQQRHLSELREKESMTSGEDHVRNVCICRYSLRVAEVKRLQVDFLNFFFNY